MRVCWRISSDFASELYVYAPALYALILVLLARTDSSVARRLGLNRDRNRK
jgi:hypothetical protein